MRLPTEVDDTMRIVRCSRFARLAHMAFACLPLLAPGAVLAQDESGLTAALALERAVTSAVARAEKSIVAIARYRKDGPPLAGLQGGPRLDPERPGMLQDRAPNELATGIVIDRAGYIVTNYHALGDPAENNYKVWVNRRPYWVKGVYAVEEVRAGDPWTDLAVLKIEAEDLHPMPLGDATDLSKGQFVIALGDPHAIVRQGQPSVSWGIVSNLNVPLKDRPNPLETNPATDTLYQYGGLIQTDVRLRFGTSGGALMNLQGKMVGLITDLAVSPAYESSLGFAIPVDTTFRVTVDRLKSGRSADFGFLGIAVESLGESWLQEGQTGARIARVVPGTPAFQAHLHPGDIITRINGHPIRDRDSLMLQLGKQSAASLIELSYHRGARPDKPGQLLQTSVVLSKRYLASLRRPFAQITEPLWRGMQIDYATALPPSLLEPALQDDVPVGCLAIVDVQRNSPGWKSGARPGMLLTHLDGRRATAPEEFRVLTKFRDGTVRLRLTTGEELTVPAE